MRNKKLLIKKIFYLTLITGYLISFSFLHTIIADEVMPDKEELANSITEQANNEITQGSSASTEVTNTGDNVDVNTSSESNTEINVDNQNDANINQEVTAVANTGDNEASRNISIGGDAGMITTGDASVNVNGQVNANNNETVISGGQGGGGASSDVVNTGNDLDVSTTSTSNTLTMVNNDNTTTINQVTDAYANTGGNVADRNISIGGNAGVINTGNASTNVNYLVTANGNVTLIGGVSNGNGPGSGASIILTNTGDDSRFTTRSTTNNFIVVTNENRALISQTCGIPEDALPPLVETASCFANTGDNTADRNIGVDSDAGVITTGDAQVNVLMAAFANGNFTSIMFDDPAFNNSNSDVVNAGDDVNVTTESTNNTDIDVDNNNQANVNQRVNAEANTGRNTANRNISLGGNAGVITTGNAEVNVEMLVNVNENVTKIKVGEVICTPTPTPGQQVVVTPTPTGAAGGVEVTATPTPTTAPAAQAVEVTPTPTAVPTGEVLGVQVPQLPAAGSESLILAIIDAFLVLTLGLIFRKLGDSIINS